MSFLDDLPPAWKLSPRAFVPGIASIHMPTSAAAQLLHLCETLHKTQFDAPAVIVRRQLQQARNILQFAKQQSPYYRDLLTDVDADAACASMEAWRALPILTRADVQTAGDTLFSTRLPQGHKATKVIKTSGSTGEPVTVRKTDVINHIFRAIVIRENLWHQRYLPGTLAAIRANAKRGRQSNWGSVLSSLFRTGPGAALPFVDIAEQLTWLQEVEPNYLLTYPSNLQALITAAADQGIAFETLTEVRTIGETVSPELRQLCEAQWSVKLTDLYSSEEVGYIACQCPESDSYHLMDENLLVEILRGDGTPCEVGEIGRVVITDLHNFATPLIRYEIRDFAELGGPCACGRGLTTVTRIMGRYRNLLRTPEGEERWPLTGFHGFDKVAPVRQYRFVQQSIDRIEATLVVDPPLTPEQRAALDQVIRTSLDWHHDLVITDQTTPIPPGPNGKFEDFVSHV